MQGWFTASALIFCVGLALVIPPVAFHDRVSIITLI